MTRFKTFVSAGFVFAAAAVLLVMSAPAREAAGAAAPASDETPPEEVTTLAKEWAVALENGKVEQIKPFLSPSYVYVNPRGQATDGAALLRQLKGKTLKLKVEPKQRRIRMHGDALVMFGLCDISGEVDGKNVDGSYQFVDVFQKKDGRWLAVVSTLTRVQDEK